MIQVGGPYTPETLNEGKVNLGNPNNPVNATYSGGGSGTISDFIWTRSSGKIYPTNLTDRIGLGTSIFVGSERLRVLGETNTDTLRTANAYIDTARLRSGTYYANLTATLTSTINLALPNTTGTLALTSDIPLFANAALLATYTNTNSAITNAISYSHQHSNYSTLNGITPTLISNWNNAYSWGNHALAGYITAETDPIFVASAAYNITGTNITNWGTAYGWGNHASVGYLTEEVDPIFIASAAYDIDSTDITNWGTAYTNTHTHTNKALLDTLTNVGAGTQFLTDDGTYKSISTTVVGNDTEIQFNDGGSSFGGDSTYTFNKTTKLVTSYGSLISSNLYLGDNTAYITNSSGDLSFTDGNAGTITLSDLITGATNYWDTTTGGIYYSGGYISNHTNPTAELDITGHIIANNFDSNYFKYQNSNLLLGPNAGDNETGDNLLYIANSNTATPLVKGDFLNQSIEFNADTYINSVKRLCFGSSEVYIRRDSTTDDMLFSDPNTNSGDPVKLSDFVRDASLYSLISDFTQYSAVTSITNANKTTWNKASVLVTTGSGDSYLSDDGTYKVINNVGNTTTLYLHDEVSDISGYEKLLNSPANNPTEDVETVAVTVGTSPILIDDYATEPSYPGVTTIPAGLWTFKTWTSVDNATGTTTITIRVYNRTTGGTETELFNVTTAEINATSATQYVIESVQPEYTIDATDRIVIKYYTSTTTASSINVSLYYEGTAHYSYIITPLSFATALINDYTWKWDTTEAYIRPYTTKTEAGGVLSAGKFYNGTDSPTAINRLNYDGDFYATYVRGRGTTTTGVEGTSNGGVGTAGNSVSNYGLYGTSTNSAAIFGSSSTGNGALIVHQGSPLSNVSNAILKLEKKQSGTVDVTENIIEITDNPTTSGTISGALFSATVETTERLRFDPRVANGASAVASFEDTHNALTTTGAKLKSFRMQGSEKAYVDKDGGIGAGTDIYLPSTGKVYLGSPSSDGSWRITINGTGLEFQRRESSTWVMKQTIEA